jgi:hypothetical protein
MVVVPMKGLEQQELQPGAAVGEAWPRSRARAARNVPPARLLRMEPLVAAPILAEEESDEPFRPGCPDERVAPGEGHREKDRVRLSACEGRGLSDDPQAGCAT